MKLNAREKNIVNAGILAGIIAGLLAGIGMLIIVEVLEVVEVTLGTGYSIAAFLAMVIVGAGFGVPIMEALIKGICKDEIERGNYEIWKKASKGKRKK